MQALRKKNVLDYWKIGKFYAGNLKNGRKCRKLYVHVRTLNVRVKVLLFTDLLSLEKRRLKIQAQPANLTHFSIQMPESCHDRTGKSGFSGVQTKLNMTTKPVIWGGLGLLTYGYRRMK